MKSVLFAISAMLMSTAAFADEPAKVMDSSAGKIYTDAKGMTLYTFDKDKEGMSSCYDDCATEWPPFVAEANAMAEGEWTIVERKDGTKMWAYEGKPLYYYHDDKKPGDMMGEGEGGAWHVAKAD
jgi:predicted lipoprotein with Yx(FWY)xxD motif